MDQPQGDDGLALRDSLPTPRPGADDLVERRAMGRVVARIATD